MREFENGISMRKKCIELMGINEQRTKDVLGTKHEYNVFIESDDEKGESDMETSSALSNSEANDDIFSHFS